MVSGSIHLEHGCPACHGYGADPCGTCDGTGRAPRAVRTGPEVSGPLAAHGVRAFSSKVATLLHPCPDCHGAGAIRCTVCHGKGRRGLPSASTTW
jgi:DnaJ-class molecular chaperone